LKTKKELKNGLLAALIMMASPLSYALTIVTATARYVETCKDHVCTQHQVSPAYFAIPVHGSTPVTMREVPSTRDLFINPDGLPVLRGADEPVSTQDCMYRGHVLKPGGEAIRYDKEGTLRWQRICHNVNRHGVMSPAVN
jgi:hypothetical protein